MFVLLRRNIIKNITTRRFITWSRHVSVSANTNNSNNKKEKITKLLKHFKKTKRRNDIADLTHPSSITILEINDFLKEYSQIHNLPIQLEKSKIHLN